MNKNRQTQLIHAPRQAPQYISTVQPPIYRASVLFLIIQMLYLIAIGRMTMTIVMEHTAHQQLSL